MVEVKKSRSFLGVIYPDSESYDCAAVLASLDDVFSEWAYVLHDRDVDEDSGEVKKAHYHWVGRRTPVGISTVAKQLGVPENSVEFCKKWKSAVRYLVHADDPLKFQYDHSLVESNLDFESFFLDGDSMAGQIFEALETRTFRNGYELGKYCWEHGLWGEFRRECSYWAYCVDLLNNEEIKNQNVR